MLAILLVVKASIIAILCYFALVEFVTGHAHVLVACAGLFVANCAAGVNFTIFSVTCHLFECRLYYINLLLQQLLFDESTEDTYIVINKQYELLSQEFNNVYWYNGDESDMLKTPTPTASDAGLRNGSLKAAQGRHEKYKKVSTLYKIANEWQNAIHKHPTTMKLRKNYFHAPEIKQLTTTLKSFLLIRQM